MAALHQNELYELAPGRAGTARLQLFGVIFGSNRVVIYLQPKNGNEHDLAANTARTHLLMNEEPLPWADWAAEFREQMPEEINNLMEEVTAGSTSKDHKQAIKDRLKQIRDLFRISKYTRSRTGDSSVAQNTAGVGLMGLFTAGWFWVLACLLLVVGAILAALGHVLESTGGSRSRR